MILQIQRKMFRKLNSLYRHRLLLVAAICVLSVFTGLQVVKVINYFQALHSKIGLLNAELEQFRGKQPDQGKGPLSAVKPGHFQYILNNKTVCSSATKELLYVIYVHSAPGNTKRREVMRTTWARNDLFLKYSSRVVFTMGKAGDEELQAMLKEESDKYGDIIQGDYKDDVRNSSQHSLLALQWLTSYCPQARYVIKAEEKTFVNVVLLVDLLLNMYAEEKPILLCMWWENMPILRHNTSNCLQWCVGKNEFPGEKFYPRYCSGAAYVLTSDAVSTMYDVTSKMPYFWIDDVYVTGLLTEKVQLLQWIQERERYEFNLHNFRQHYRKTSEPTFMVTTVEQDSFLASTWQLVLGKLTSRQRDLIGEDRLKALQQSLQQEA